MKTTTDEALPEALGAEGAALLVPADAFEATGCYEKLRIVADTICRAQLRETLPPEWQDTCVGLKQFTVGQYQCKADSPKLFRLHFFLLPNSRLVFRKTKRRWS